MVPQQTKHIETTVRSMMGRLRGHFVTPKVKMFPCEEIQECEIIANPMNKVDVVIHFRVMENESFAAFAHTDMVPIFDGTCIQCYL